MRWCREVSPEAVSLSLLLSLSFQRLTARRWHNSDSLEEAALPHAPTTSPELGESAPSPSFTSVDLGCVRWVGGDESDTEVPRASEKKDARGMGANLTWWTHTVEAPGAEHFAARRLGPRGVKGWLGRIGQLGPNRAQFIFSIFSLLSNFFSSLFLSLIWIRILNSKLFQIYFQSYCEVKNTNFGNITILFISFLLFSFSKTLISNLGFNSTSSIYFLIMLIIIII